MPQTGPQAAIERAFRTGDAQALLEDAAERIEIMFFGQGMLYSRAQARYVMQDFFRQYPPVQFRMQHASTTGGSWFGTGTYAYERGERPLQVYVRLKRQGRDRWEVREIRIEERLRE